MFSITPEHRCSSMLALQDLPGVGSSLADRLSRTLGSEGAVIEALDRGDVASLTAVEGLSANRAIRLIKAARGSDPDICRSGEGEALHRCDIKAVGGTCGGGCDVDQHRVAAVFATLQTAVAMDLRE